MAKDRTPGNPGKGGAARGGSPSARGGSSPARGGSSSAGKGAPGRGAGGRGRTRPPTQVVTQNRRPWGLIAAAVAVLVFAVAAISYAVVQVNRAEAEEITSPDEIEGVESYDYEAGTHVTTPVQYSESPPVGGEHAGVPEWADCTGVVYDVDVRHENVVHSMEHGAVWVTYNPDEVSDADVETLAELVDGQPYRLMSPYEGLDSPISIQSWGQQLKVDSATDPRLEQFADFFTQNPEFTPEDGASCENPTWLTSPILEESDGQVPAEEPPAEGSPAEESPAEESPATGSAAPSSSAGATETPAQ